MSMKLLPVDDTWVGTMISLADGPWTAQSVERTFVDLGWAQPDPAGIAHVHWNVGDVAMPVLYLFEDPAENDDDAEEPAGWRLELGTPPPDQGSGESRDIGSHAFREIWDRGTMALTLTIEDDINSYSYYDHIALGVWPADSADWTGSDSA
ncbi:hypothetical protein [Actinomadura alba]|uniref:Uncharacterized protein n=1 Tax=Actinomadura alba TaxID=406431 RepID=A0ABR7LJH9_9ACTN|nr:hypothetical protein [Actinomadura alba]MBC6464744.1 hypothetical protein [Actinomadura alba]